VNFKKLVMRNVLILLTLFMLTFILKVNSQVYYQIPDTNAIWSVNTNKYAPLGDTIMNSLNYTKFYKTTGDSIFDFQNADYYAAVYEDSNKKVWGVKHDSLSKRLLYDFSLEIGDTATVYPYEEYNNNAIDSVNIIVLDIDSVMIFSSYRKRFTITPSFCGTGWDNYEYWIEGIGSTAGLFSPGTFQPCVVDLLFYELLCFQENNVTEYFNSYQSCYRPVTSNNVNEILDKNLKVEIFPNPLYDHSIMKIEQCNKGDQINFFDVFGKKITSYEIKSKSEKIVLNKDDFKNTRGVYFYRILSEKIVVKSGRLMVK